MEVQNQLNYIEEGMEVYDVNGDLVGSVEYVYVGNDTIAGKAPDIATVKAEILFALGNTQYPDAVILRLHNTGFVRVGRGFFKSDAIVLPVQISNVRGDRVSVTVTTAELLKS